MRASLRFRAEGMESHIFYASFFFFFISSVSKAPGKQKPKLSNQRQADSTHFLGKLAFARKSSSCIYSKQSAPAVARAFLAG